MKDINGNEIKSGIVRYNNYYYKVFTAVRDKLVVSGACDSLEGARQQDELDNVWESDGIVGVIEQVEYESLGGVVGVIEQIEYESLGVYDSNGKEYKYGDVISFEEELGPTESIVVGSIPSLKLDDPSFIIHNPNNENYNCIDNCNKYKVIRSILDKKVDKGEKLIKETIELCKKTQEDMKIVGRQISAVLRKLEGKL